MFKTGFEDLDKMVGGFKEGQLITICSVVAMGKSTLMKQIFDNIQEKKKKFISFENKKLNVNESLKDPKVIFFDYLQIMSKEPQILALDIQAKAREENACIVIASQMYRKINERQGHRPQLCDVKDGLDELSDVVIAILRREYYDPMDKPGMAELIIMKNRYGPLGSIHLRFDKEIPMFETYTPVNYYKEPLI